MPSLSDYHQFVITNDLYQLALFAVGIIGGLLAVALNNRRVKPLPLIPLWFVMLIALALRLPRMLEPLWYDETFAVAVGSLPFSQMLQVILSDVHPPTHYALIAPLIAIFGDSAIVVRLPSLIAGLIMVFAVYRLAPRQYAVLSALIVAMMPAAIHYSAEARYPIFLALTVVGALLAIKHKHPAAVVLSGLPSWWHPVGVFYMPALWLYMRRRGYGLRYVMASVAVGVVWFPLYIMQATDVINGFWLILRQPLSHLLSGYTIHSNLLILPVLLVFGAIVGMSITRKYMLIIWVVPFMVFLVSAIIAPVYLHRALLASVVLLAIPMATVFGNQFRPLLVVLLGLSVVMYFTGGQDVNMKRLIDTCDESITATSTATTISIMYFADVPVYTHAIDNYHQWLSDDAKNALGFNQPPPDADCVFIQRDYGNHADEIKIITGMTRIASQRINQFAVWEIYR